MPTACSFVGLQGVGTTCLLVRIALKLVLCVTVTGVEVRAEQGRVHALPQGAPDAATHPRHVRRQREGGEHGRVA